mmetsp:Transcript_29460/g.97002  ORF Transcript_29460/g.97002 Transcript_29460/m.97002 type:complete len:214 (+) Transcript_29460:1178-1819(+)
MLGRRALERERGGRACVVQGLALRRRAAARQVEGEEGEAVPPAQVQRHVRERHRVLRRQRTLHQRGERAGLRAHVCEDVDGARPEREERGGAAATPSDGRVRLVAEHHVREKSVRGRVARSERVHHHKASPCSLGPDGERRAADPAAARAADPGSGREPESRGGHPPEGAARQRRRHGHRVDQRDGAPAEEGGEALGHALVSPPRRPDGEHVH